MRPTDEREPTRAVCGTPLLSKEYARDLPSGMKESRPPTARLAGHPVAMRPRPVVPVPAAGRDDTRRHDVTYRRRPDPHPRDCGSGSGGGRGTGRYERACPRAAGSVDRSAEKGLHRGGGAAAAATRRRMDGRAVPRVQRRAVCLVIHRHRRRTRCLAKRLDRRRTLFPAGVVDRAHPAAKRKGRPTFSAARGVRTTTAMPQCERCTRWIVHVRETCRPPA